ncbi:unnamed protein product [Cuscuta campestris]|uniref:COI1 F-box domain-containing protein n=1 Tax=Cuscuta campestris TaxID=132261 RepID=A0A484K6H1_9ASTE|nr:unnamed protein product [Cuscuta campestris]
MWRFVDMRHLVRYGYFDDVCNKDLETMCRQAVDMSQGQLTELHIDHFATDQLLHYISERSSKLQSLQIRGCDEVGYGFIEAAKNFPLLEELHFVYVLCVRDYIEAIGQSCPKLKSFTLSSSDYRDGLLYGYGECNNNFEALAIAKTMPGLHHLRLVGNNMTNEGLQAILDGCPNLESLDIRRCYRVNLRGEIGDRITEKIKDFKCPNDPVKCGSDWDADPFYDEDYSDEFDDTPYIDY